MLPRLYVALLLAIASFIIWQISQVEYWNLKNWIFLGILLIGIKKDQRDIPWIQYLPKGILTLALLYGTYRYAPLIWGTVSSWEVKNVQHLWNWNELFRKIPFNDGAIFRIYQPEIFTKFMRWVYGFGFSLTVWLSVIRSFFVKDIRKMIQYVLTTQVLQLPIIMFFYMTIYLQEVWFVLGDPDGMARIFTYQQANDYVINCFPSMHTSVSFAVLLLALQEKSKVFKWIMVTYCSLVIYSTLYLEIHWVLDVLAGMVLGYIAVKLANWIVGKFAVKETGTMLPISTRVSSKPYPLIKNDPQV